MPPSRLVVLGGCGAWPEGGRACSGFVLEHDGARIVLDLGYGTLPRLLALLGSSSADGIDAIIVTHKHPDHMVDLHGLFRARWFGRRGADAIGLYAPDGVLARIVALEDDGAEPVRRVLDWHPLPAAPYQVGPFRLESVALPHFVPNAGVRLSAPGLTVAYTGDTGPDPALGELGRDADLYIVEATSRDQQPGGPPPAGTSGGGGGGTADAASGGGAAAEASGAAAGPRMHLTAREAGQVAAAAQAGRLMLTHFWPGNDRQASRAAAAEAFTGEILLAEEGLEVPLP